MPHPPGAHPPSSVPPAEVAIDVDLVRHLLEAQHPDLAELPLTVHAEGWDNVTVRCGDDLAVRLPRRRLGAELIGIEMRWLPHVAPHLPVVVPAALRVGTASEQYPWSWCVVPWIDGEEATPWAVRPESAPAFGEILRALHSVVVPAQPPRNRFRGGPLRKRAEAAMARLDRLERSDDPLGGHVAQLRKIFDRGLAAPTDDAETWLHGDLHPRNVLAIAGEITGIIDWGDMCAGDPSTDLAAVWLLFPPEVHDAVWDVYAPTAHLLDRARAWTVAYGVMLLEAGKGGEPRHEAAGRAGLDRILR